MRGLLIICMLSVGLFFLLLAIYLLNGSLELFPTAEHQSDVRLTQAIAMIFLLLLEFVLWKVLRRLRPS